MSKQKTAIEVVEEFRKVWGNRWDYSKVEYSSANSPVRIVCLEHGEFLQLPNNHKRGHVGCGGCSGKTLKGTEKFISEARLVNGDRWDYSLTKYINNHQAITIICRDHGEFTQHPRSHLRGHVGCPKCNRWSVSVQQFKEQSPFKEAFDYSKVDFTGTRDKVTITCKIHGDFEQVADSHLRGFIGCRSCQTTGSSQGEREVAHFLRSLDLEVKENVRGLLSNSRQEIDMFLPTLRVGVEFNGLYYHSDKFKVPRYHYDKYESAQASGIRLIQVWEDDWESRRSVVEEHLRQVVGKSTLSKINARDTEVILVPSHQAKQFLEAYHIQGYVGSSVQVGLKHEGCLVAVACFKLRGEDYELVRYATSANVRGGHSKIVAHFERTHTYQNLITFADRTFSDGGLYSKTGWVKDRIIRADYSYVVGGKRHHKFNFRLKRFRSDPSLEFVGGMTEAELARLNNILRIYDAGKIRFIKPHPA